MSVKKHGNKVTTIKVLQKNVKKRKYKNTTGRIPLLNESLILVKIG